MNITIIQIALWVVFAGVAGGAIVHFKKPEQMIEIPDENPRLIERYKEADLDDEVIDVNQFKAFEKLSWVKIKPPPKRVIKKKKEDPQAPFHLTRVVSSRLVELMSLKDRSKKTYSVPQDITKRQGVKKKKIGRVLKLEEVGSDYHLQINYEGKEYILVLQKDKQGLYDRMGKIKNKRKYVNRDPSRVEEHEGKKTGPNSFQVNYEFFNALIDNAAEEGSKINFAQDTDGNFKITRLADDSVLKKFGFNEQDVLIGFQGKKIKSPKDLLGAYTGFISSRKDTAKITVKRGGKQVDIDVKILKNIGKFKEFYE